MVFAHDTTAALQAAVALVNSAEPPDTMTTGDELDEFFAAHDYTGSRTHDAAELDSVRALRAPLRRLLTSDRDGAVRIVNGILAERHAVPAHTSKSVSRSPGNSATRTASSRRSTGSPIPHARWVTSAARPGWRSRAWQRLAR